MCSMNVVNRISWSCLIIFTLEGIGDGFGHPLAMSLFHSTVHFVLSSEYLYFTGCETLWSRQRHKRYRPQHYVKHRSWSASRCAATCRTRPNCSLYELNKPAGTCTLAADYDEYSADVDLEVISFPRVEHSCRLRGMPLRIFQVWGHPQWTSAKIQ